MSQYRKTQQGYILIVSLLGIILSLTAFLRLNVAANFYHFLLFLGLGVFAQISATSATIKAKAAITYSVSPSISLATVPFFGVGAAVLVETATSIALWLFKPADEVTWKRSWAQVGFNMGMSAISIYCGAFALEFITNTLPGDSLWILILPWLAAAIINDQINLWLVAIMLRLQHGRDFAPWQVYKESAWAIPIGILGTSVGGGFLAFAYGSLSWLGLAVFFLPILLTAYAFRLYVNQMQDHMDNLETIVAERTQDIQNLMREKDAFLAVLTHDMKTPLSSINIYASLLRDHPARIIEKPHIAERILKSQKTLTEIVDNILDLEKLQVDGSMPLEIERLELTPLLESTIESLSGQAGEKDISLNLESEANEIIIEADRLQIERVFQNIIGNAIK